MRGKVFQRCPSLRWALVEDVQRTLRYVGPKHVTIDDVGVNEVHALVHGKSTALCYHFEVGSPRRVGDDVGDDGYIGYPYCISTYLLLCSVVRDSFSIFRTHDSIKIPFGNSSLKCRQCGRKN